MRDKLMDTHYMGVDKQKILKATPILNEVNFKHLHTWITGRYMIHKRKDVMGLPPPWTKNKILKNYRFTNVKREHDRETIWVMNNITGSDTLSYEDKLLNVILFRMYNKSDTISIIYKANGGNPLQLDSLNSVEAIKKEMKRCDDKYKYYTSAFMVSGMLRELGCRKDVKDEFSPIMPVKFVKYLHKIGIAEDIKKCADQKEVFKVLRNHRGLGRFLAYQIYVDFTYIEEFPFSENHFTVSGPGCSRGLNYIFQDFGGLNDEEALFWLRDNITTEFLVRGFKWAPFKMFDDLPEYDRCMNIMSLENCMCEISKYIRALEGGRLPRNKYIGGK